MELRRQRILTQGIGSHFDSPLEVVSALGAVQAQDYLGALWAVGLRTRGAVETSVELAWPTGPSSGPGRCVARCTW